MCGCLSHASPATWPATQACAPDWELNQQSFGLQASAQSIEPHQPGRFNPNSNLDTAASTLRLGNAWAERSFFC